MEQDSKPKLSVQYNESAPNKAPTDAGNSTASNDSKDSEDDPLLSHTRIQGKIILKNQKLLSAIIHLQPSFHNGNSHVKQSHQRHQSQEAH